MPHREMYGFTRLLIQFAQIRKAQAPDIELPSGRLPNRETCDPKMMDSFPIAIKKSRCHQIREEAVHRAHRQAGEGGHLLCGQSSWRLAEKMQQAQTALKGSDVVISLGAYRHRRYAKMKARNYLMKMRFCASPKLTIGQLSLPPPQSISIARSRST